VLVASPDWKGRPLERILKEERIIDFCESDSTTLRYLQNFELEKHLGGRNRLFVNENEALIHYFISGVGFGTLTESIAHDYIEKGKLIRMNGGRALEDPLALAWYARSKEMAYFRDILGAIK
jgi:DNA-binding transcriptional LysR family regulator